MPPPPPLPPTSIRVKLPPSSSRPAATAAVSSSSETPQALSSSLSSIFETASIKKQDANQSVKIPSSSSSYIPLTPRKNGTSHPSSPSSSSAADAIPRKADGGQPYTPPSTRRRRKNTRRLKNVPASSSDSLSLLLLRDNHKSPTPVKKAALSLASNAKVLSLSSSVSSNKGTNDDKKKEEKKILNSDGTPSPTSSSSSSSSSSSIRIVGENRRTRNARKKKDIKPLSLIKNHLENEKVDDPLKYQDPLLLSTSNSTSSSTTFTSSIPSSSASSNTEISSSAVAEVKRTNKDDDGFENANDAPFLIVKKKKNVVNHNDENQDEKKAKENLLPPPLLLHGQKEKDEEGNDTSFENWMTMTSKGFDDSGCEIEWEGSSYSGRARTTSLESSIFTTCCSSTSSEEGTEIDTSPLNDVFYASTFSSTTTPSKKILNNTDSSFFSPSITFERDLLLDESFPSFNGVHDTFVKQIGHHQLGSRGNHAIEECGSRLIEKEEGFKQKKLSLAALEEVEQERFDEDEDDFPLSMLEKNLRGLIDEPLYYHHQDNYHGYQSPDEDQLYPSSPTLRFCSLRLTPFHHLEERDKEGRRTTSPEHGASQKLYAAARDQRFIGASPFPLPPPTVRNALESFETKLELSKKENGYPFFSSSTTTTSTSASRSSFSSLQMQSSPSAISGTFYTGNQKTLPPSTPFMQRAAENEGMLPLCRCGCGEENLLASTASSSRFEKDLFPTVSSYAPKGSTTTKGMFNGSIHKSIWSISSPPTSPTKNMKSSVHSAFANLGSRTNLSTFELEQSAFDQGNASTYMPADEYCFPENYANVSQPGPESPFGVSASKNTLKKAVSSDLRNETYSSHLPYYYHASYHAPLHQHAHCYSEGARGAFPRHAYLTGHRSNHSMHQQHYHHHHHHPYGPSPNNKKGELYKTELCRSWSEIGSCRYAEKCQFAHGLEELRPMPSHYYNPHQNQHHHYHRHAHGSFARHHQDYLDHHHYPMERENGQKTYAPIHARGHSYPSTCDEPHGSSATMQNNHSAFTESGSVNFNVTTPPPHSASAYKVHNFEGEVITNSGRRRSVSSPSKVRMYNIARDHEASEAAFGSTGWKESHLDSEITFSPFNMSETPQRARMQRNFTLPLQTEKADKSSLFAALKAEAADAPAPSFTACA